MWAVVDEFAPAGQTATQWCSIGNPAKLAFDHNRILAEVRPLLSETLWRRTDFTRVLTGKRFAASRAVELTAALSGAAPDPGNLNRTLKAVPGLVRTEERVRVKATGRPAVVWEWSPDQ